MPLSIMILLEQLQFTNGHLVYDLPHMSFLFSILDTAHHLEHGPATNCVTIQLDILCLWRLSCEGWGTGAEGQPANLLEKEYLSWLVSWITPRFLCCPDLAQGWRFFLHTWDISGSFYRSWMGIWWDMRDDVTLIDRACDPDSEEFPISHLLFPGTYPWMSSFLFAHQLTDKQVTLATPKQAAQDSPMDFTWTFRNSVETTPGPYTY
ncbi:hypothetical protein F4678DRAFT_278483 [Xylaria arbuscula]|nr:hypothetical protein F4678DRAFT_278483 [Xylaria arbuscula]